MTRGPESFDAEALLRHAPWVRRLARKLARTADDADDVAQDAFVAAIEGGGHVRGGWGPWLGSVVRNLAARRARRSDLGARAESAAARAETSSAAAADDVVAKAEIHRRVVDAVLALDEPQRSTLLLRYFEGRSFAAIAASAGEPAATVRARHRRGLAEVRRRLARPDARGLSPVLLVDLSRLGGLHSGGAVAPMFGALLMTTKSKGLAVAVVALAAFLLVQGEQVPQWSAGAAADVAFVRGEGKSTEGPAALRTAAAPVASTPFADRKPRTMIGTVVSEDGEPIHGATVRMASTAAASIVDGDGVPTGDAAFMEARTDASGSFEIAASSEAPHYFVSASAPGFSPDFAGPAPPNEALRLVLRRPLSLRGFVRDLDERATPSAEVAVSTIVCGFRFVRRATTQTDGSYRIDDVPRNFDASAVVVEATAPGFARQALGYFPTADAEDTARHDFYLPRGATLRGRVVDDATGAPIGGARVTPWVFNAVGSTVRLPNGDTLPSPDMARRLATVETATDGTFVLAALPSWAMELPGLHTASLERRVLGGIAAETSGYAHEGVALDVPDEGAEIVVALRLRRRGGVRGRVVDEWGAPIAGIRVYPEIDRRGLPPSTAKPTTTDADGRYMIDDLPIERVGGAATRLVAFAARVGPGPTIVAKCEIALSAGVVVDAPDIVVVGDPRQRARFVVRTPDGSPVVGASVAHESLTERRLAETDHEGRASVLIEGPLGPDEPGVIFRAPGRRDVLVRNPITGDESVNHVVMDLGRVIRGRVFRNGLPFPSAHVRAGPPQGDGIGDGAAECFADRDGRFTLGGLPAGPCRAAVVFRARDETRLGRAVDVPEGRDEFVLTAENDDRVDPPPPARGSVVVRCSMKPTGRPLLRALVSLDGVGEFLTLNATRPGRFEARNLSSGRYRISASAPGVLGPEPIDIDVQGDAAEPVSLDWAFTEGVALEGRVTLPNDAPFRSARGHLSGHGGRSFDVAADGRFKFDGLRPGAEYELVVWAAADASGQVTFLPVDPAPLRVPEGLRRFECVIPLQAGGGLSVLIRSRALFPLDRADRALAKASLLEVRSADGRIRRTLRGVHDNYGWALPVGDYVVSLAIPGRETVEMTAVVGVSTAQVRFEID